MVSIPYEVLRKNIALSDLPDEHLQWILDHSEYREYADGELIAQYGQPAENMWFSLEGKVIFYMYINGRQVYYFTFENNNITGGVGGMMPYSRMKTYPGNSYSLGESKLLRIHKDHFVELEALNPAFIQKLISFMTERAKAFATTQLQHEKVSALGNLAAGIAHELNNPAAAISEISGELSKRLSRNYQLTKSLLASNLTPEHIEKIHTLVEQMNQAPPSKLSSLQRLEAEDEMDEWLEKNGVRSREIAETFVDAGFSKSDLDTIRNGLDVPAFTQLIPWLENLINSQKIIEDLAGASNHISALVTSIKSHVQMDRSNEWQPTNIHTDIDNTLTLLGFKLRAKNIKVIKNFCSNMPDVPAYVGELNQVWTNVIDNAIYAVQKNGTITIGTRCNAKDIQVDIIDNGGGIPPDIESRIFDPFFTTKKVGEGTGIGLDLVNRILKKHNGTIQATSKPGETIFSICVPTQQKASE